MFISELFNQHPGLDPLAAESIVELSAGAADPDAVRAIQLALIALGYDQPEYGVDGDMGGETGTAVTEFRRAHGLDLGDYPAVDLYVALLMDREVAFLEGAVDRDSDLTHVVHRDPLMAAVSDHHFATSFAQGIIDSLEFGNKICFRASDLLGLQIAQALGHAVEPYLFADYQGQFPTGDLYLDGVMTPFSSYRAFLERNHAGTPSFILKVAQGVRPDIASHRESPPAFYELKPDSPSGMAKGIAKVRVLTTGYKLAFPANPYLPGTGFLPTSPIVLGTPLADAGEQLRLTLNFRRCAPGLILYWFCVEGDLVQLVNRVKLVAAIAAILVCLLEAAIAAAAVAGAAAIAAELSAAVAAIQAMVAELGLALPFITMALNPP